MLGEIVDECHRKSVEAVEKAKKENGFFELQRGYATIPLPGIDVPFHSRYLWAGVMPFRACKSSSYSRSVETVSNTTR